MADKPASTLIERMEQDEQKLAELVAADNQRLIDAMGPRKFGEKARPALLRLMKSGPLWHVYGNAEPDIANGYWDGKLGLGPDYETGVVDPDAGPLRAEQFSRDMYVLAAKYPLELAQFIASDPALVAEYQQMKAAGLHLGKIKPPLEAYLKDYPEGWRVPLAATPEDHHLDAMPTPAMPGQPPQAGPPMPAAAPAPPMPMMGGANG